MKARVDSGAAPLVRVTRGGLTESLHRGHVVAMDGGGHLVAALGNPSTVTVLRSASKPQQAVPLVASGAADSFGFDERELAVARSVEQFSGVPFYLIAVGVDGCGVPSFGIPLSAAAMLAARLVAPPAPWDAATRGACRRVVSAMLKHPEMVEGAGEMDTEIMSQTGGRLVSKVGAEGVYAASVLPCKEWPRGLGVALKIEDGDRAERARPVAVVETLRQLGLLRPSELDALSRFASAALRNHRGERVGAVRAAFELRRA